MLGDHQDREDHAKFRELMALAGTGTITSREVSELHAHLGNCEECQEIARQYLILKTQGIPTLAATYGERQEQSSWDEASTRQKLFARVRAEQQPCFEPKTDRVVAVPAPFLGRIAANPFTQTLLAACLVIMVGAGA